MRCALAGLMLLMSACPAPDGSAGESGTYRMAAVATSAESVVALTASGGIAGAIGSGVIVGAGGYVLVADHVASTGFDIEVVTRQGLRPVQRIARDPVFDLQLVRSAGLHGPVIAGLRETSPEPGMRVWAVGVGSGSPEPRPGTVTAVDIVVEAVLPAQALVKTDIRLAPGDSGGALLDAEGRLVGLLAAARGDGDRAQAVAIPAEAIGRFLARVEADQLPDRGWLGLYVRETRSRGLVVVSFANDSPALAGGLQTGDRILRLDGEPVGDRGRFRALVGAIAPGQAVQLVFLRDGEQLQRTVTTARLPQPG